MRASRAHMATKPRGASERAPLGRKDGLSCRADAEAPHANMAATEYPLIMSIFQIGMQLPFTQILCQKLGILNLMKIGNGVLNAECGTWIAPAKQTDSPSKIISGKG